MGVRTVAVVAQFIPESDKLIERVGPTLCVLSRDSESGDLGASEDKKADSSRREGTHVERFNE